MSFNLFKPFPVYRKKLVSAIVKYQKTNIPPWKWSSNDQLESFVLFPAAVGGVCGSLWGANEGFKYSKQELFVVNVAITGSGLVWGYWLGFLGGCIWPVSTTVAISRLLYPRNETDKKPIW